MNTKVLLDANVILDFLLERHESAKLTSKIVRQIEDRKIEGYLTFSIIHILGYWLSKEWGSEKAKKGLLILLNEFKILNGDKDIAINALSSSMKDIEDALQYQTAISYHVDVLITRDKNFIKSANPVLPIYTPEQFVKEFIDKKN